MTLHIAPSWLQSSQNQQKRVEYFDLVCKKRPNNTENENEITIKTLQTITRILTIFVEHSVRS